MSARLEIRLHDRVVGTIANLPGDINAFAFDESFASDPTAPTLSFRAFRDGTTGEYRTPTRPVRTRAHPYFSNLLPEGALHAYLSRHARVNPARDYPLLALLGRDLPGALVIVSAGDDSERGTDAEPGPVAGALRFSLAGVQLKFSATGDPDGGLTVPASGFGRTWIVKLPDARFGGVPENEFSMLSLARAVGIETPRIALVATETIRGLPADARFATGRALAVERFDRRLDGTRVHTEDFAQANAVFPAAKYRAANFETLAEQIARFGGNDAALEFVRRLAFTVLIGNGDMHLKNWSVIYRDGRTPTLAPAYDYVSTVVYLANEDLGLNFMGSKAFDDVDEARWRALADRARIPRAAVLRAVRETADRVRSAWAAVMDETAAEPSVRRAIEAHMGRVLHR